MSRRVRKRNRGFTLLEVMIGLGILAFSLTVLMKSSSNSMTAAVRAQMIGVATDLSRGKMYDVEETLLKDGFTDTDQSQDNRDFGEEGWPTIKYSYKVEQVELPNWEDLQAMTQKATEGSGSGSAGSGAFGGDANTFQNSALGGMLGQLGGGGGGGADVDSKNGSSFIQSQYSMVSEVLKVSIRKVTLTVTYPVPGNDDEQMVTVAYFTDAAAMDKVLMGLGSQEIADPAAGSGSGSGSGRGSGSGSGTRTPTRPTGTGSSGK